MEIIFSLVIPVGILAVPGDLFEANRAKVVVPAVIDEGSVRVL